MAPLGERAITGEDIAELGFSDVIKFFPRHVGAIELDRFVFHHLSLRTQILIGSN
ncbi:hypothetical protein D3C78_1872120 [compost metagenome]